MSYQLNIKAVKTVTVQVTALWDI